MTVMWLVMSFNYYLINYLASNFANAYSVVVASQISEVIGQLTGGILFKFLGTKRCLITCSAGSTLAGLGIIFYG